MIDTLVPRRTVGNGVKKHIVLIIGSRVCIWKIFFSSVLPDWTAQCYALDVGLVNIQAVPLNGVSS